MSEPIYAEVAWERAFVGGMLQAKPTLFAQFLGSADPDLLTDVTLRRLLEACRQQFGETGRHDLGDVYRRCRREGLAVTGELFDQLMQEYHGGDAPLTGYLEVLRDARKQRAARTVRQAPAQRTGQGSLDAISLALAAVPPIEGATVGTGADAGVRTWVEAIDHAAAPSVLATGLAPLDAVLGGGFTPGSFVVIGARTSHGKSALALRLARGIFQSLPEDQAVPPGQSQPSRVLVHTLEMSVQEQLGRLVSDLTGLENTRVQRAGDTHWTAAELTTLTGGMRTVQSWPIMLRDTDAVWADHLAAYVRWRAEHPEAVALVVDYLGLIRGVTAERRYQELGLISRALKQLAVATSLCVFGVSQINRAYAGQKEGPPELHHLRESGDLEQNCDVALLLHCPAIGQPEDPTPMEIHVAKNRHGATGTVSAAFDRRYCRIEAADAEGEATWT
jgi:replicative DNA helicase